MERERIEKVLVDKNNNIMRITRQLGPNDNIDSVHVKAKKGVIKAGYIKNMTITATYEDAGGTTQTIGPLDVVNIPDDIMIETNACTWYFWRGQWWQVCP